MNKSYFQEIFRKVYAFKKVWFPIGVFIWKTYALNFGYPEKYRLGTYRVHRGTSHVFDVEGIRSQLRVSTGLSFFRVREQQCP